MVPFVTGSDRTGDSTPVLDATGAIRHEYDWSSLPPSIAIVELLANAFGCEPTALDPLHETVDPDALDTLFRSSGPRATETDVTVSFEYVSHEVTVESDGSVVVRPVDAWSDAT